MGSHVRTGFQWRCSPRPPPPRPSSSPAPLLPSRSMERTAWLMAPTTAKEIATCYSVD